MPINVLAGVLLALHGVDGAALTCRVEADSTLRAPRFAVQNLFDGDTQHPESRWASARTSAPHWVRFEFDAPTPFDFVGVWGHGEREYALSCASLEVLVDKQWQTTDRVEDNTARVVELRTGGAVGAAYRLAIDEPCRKDATARLFEVAFFRGKEQLALRVVVAAEDRAPGHDPVDDETLLQSVAPFPTGALAMSTDRRSADLMRSYLDSIRAWGDVIADRFEAVPDHPAWGYYDLGGNQENDVRPIAYAAYVNAFLSQVEADDHILDNTTRSRCLRQAVAALAYLAQAHVTGTGACLNNKPWGDQWQSAMWARCACMAGWMLWAEIDDPLRLALARVAEHEADRFLDMPPKSSEFKDTGAEENAWNAGMLALAAVMLPDHPRAAAWDEAAKRYLYNSLSMALDAEDKTLEDGGRPVCEWVTTVNAHPDVTVENHGLVHVGYLKTTVGLMLEAGSQYALDGAPPPRACLHHVPEAFENLCACMAWDGAPVYFGGNDWKLVHTQGTDLSIYAMLGLFQHDPAAARLEGTALAWTQRIQDEEQGFYNVRRDIEYGGLVATRLAACYMAHATCGAGPRPLSERALQRRLTGVRKLAYAETILHRTPTKFASFSWGPKRMGLALPENGSWVVWPHYGSYLGLIDGQDASRGHAEVVDVRTGMGEDGFMAVIRLNRGEGNVRHEAVFVSPPGDVVFYVERITVLNGSPPQNRRTGVVGHEYPLGVNERTVYFDGGDAVLVGEGNQAGARVFETDWFNVGNQIGYVVKRLPEHRNVVQYEDREKGDGRVPKLQEWYSLIGDPDAWNDATDYACLVTYLNQSSKRTARCAESTQFSINGGIATVRTKSHTLRVDFDALTVTVTPALRGDWDWTETPAEGIQ